MSEVGEQERAIGIRERHDAQKRIIDTVNGGYGYRIIEPDKLSEDARNILRAGGDLLLASEGQAAALLDALERSIPYLPETVSVAAIGTCEACKGPTTMAERFCRDCEGEHVTLHIFALLRKHGRLA